MNLTAGLLHTIKREIFKFCTMFLNKAMQMLFIYC